MVLCAILFLDELVIADFWVSCDAIRMYLCRSDDVDYYEIYENGRHENWCGIKLMVYAAWCWMPFQVMLNEIENRAENEWNSFVLCEMKRRMGGSETKKKEGE